MTTSTNPSVREDSAKQTISLPKSDLCIQPDVKLAPHTTWRVGGSADWYVEPQNVEQLKEAWQWGKSQQLPIFFLGAGSNLLVSDEGVRGLTIVTRKLKDIDSAFDEENIRLTVAAGKMLGTWAWKAARRGWSGLEWAAGIPGTIGGAVVMNGGAHNSCAADVLVSALVMSPDGTIETLTPADLGFAYRTSNLQGSDRLVLQATFQLQVAESPEAVINKTHHDLDRRHRTQPYDRPSCGSVFRNPLPKHAAELIESAGLKGHRIGGAEISQLHANFIVNTGTATANDILQLIEFIRDRIHDSYGIELETEVKMIGEFDK
jgi:UDP-N-acetylmuramate dehydrogenase